jgi:diadenylate cyclase
VLGGWINLFSGLTWAERGLMALDLFLVYLIVYRVLLLIRGTRAVQILTGIGIVTVAFFISDRLKLSVVNYLLKQFFDYLFLIVVIIFQDEIRRALANVGRNPFVSGPAGRTQAEHVLDEVVKACNVLAAKRVGALIVFERQHGLKNYTDGSTWLDAEVSAELLVSIFQSTSPIHDGAVILRGRKILAAGCFFPLTLESEIDRNLGTRHRAAVAVSQETDALAIVLSEERGEVSCVEFGDITRDLSLSDLKRKLSLAFDLGSAQPQEGGTSGG